MDSDGFLDTTKLNDGEYDVSAFADDIIGGKYSFISPHGERCALLRYFKASSMSDSKNDGYVCDFDHLTRTLVEAFL